MQFEPSRLASYNPSAILAEMLRVAKRYFDGQAPSHKEFNRRAHVHSATVVKVFGSWEAAWRKAGLEYVRSPVKTAAIIADLQRILQITGGYFSYRSYRENGGLYSHATILKRLGGGWPNVLSKALNVRPTPHHVKETDRSDTSSQSKPVGHERGKQQVTAEELLADLRSITPKVPKDVLSYHDYRALGGKRCHATFHRVFGSWPNAVRAIGFKSGKYKHRQRKPNYTNEEYFEELQRVWEILGRQPRAGDMKANGSRMSPQAFQDRFGSWLRAIHAFCLDRNGPDGNVNTLSSGAVSESMTLEASQSSGCDKETAHLVNDFIVARKRPPQKASMRLRWKVFQRDRYTCQACGRTAPNVELELDHIVPYSQGGETVLENLQLLCRECNLGKSDLPPFPSGKDR